MTAVYAKRPLGFSDFVFHREAGVSSGIDGLNSLVNLLREDVKEILKEFHIPEPSKRWKELQALIEPYRRDWDSFAKSDSCPLPKEQLDVIEYCRKYDDLSLLANDNGYTYSYLAETLNAVIRRLSYAKFIPEYFAKWQEYRFIRIYDTENFLNAPLQVIRKKMSDRLYYLLELYGKSMAEILQKVTLEKLRNLRGFGIGKEKELKDLLRQYGCYKMLK